MTFFEALQYCIENNLIFAAYRLPHSDSVRLIVQKSPVAKKVKITSKLFSHKGFLVSPFIENKSNYSYFITPDLNYISTDYSGFSDLLLLIYLSAADILARCGCKLSLVLQPFHDRMNPFQKSSF